MSTIENTAAPKPDVYQKVTDAIVAAIESGVGQYQMPWTVRQDRGFSPISVGSAKPYRGINTLVLWAESQTRGYSSALWGTYQQWAGVGGQVRKGERGSPVVFWGTFEKQTAEGEPEKSHRGLFAKPGSIQRRLNAIAEAHKAVGAESPTHSPLVANTMNLKRAPVPKV